VVSVEEQRVDPQVFRQVISHFASGVTVITTRHQGINYGLTASAVTSLTLEPPMLLACINKNTRTQAAISWVRVFAVNILDEGQADLAYKFARPQSDKFRDVEYTYGQFGEPLLVGALAHIECRVAADVEAGTHRVFLAEVEQAKAYVGSPLTYFRGKFGRFGQSQDEAIYREMRQHILSREIALGEALDPYELASKFETAQSSTFYALTKLTAEGLVSRDLTKGYVVTPVDMKTLEEAFNARCDIEVGVAERTVGHTSHDDLAELRKRMEATLPLVVNQRFVDFERYVEANRAFHEYMVSLAKNNTLLDAYRRLSVDAIVWRVMWRVLDKFEHASETAVTDHRRLVDAYESGDVPYAKSVITGHTERAKRVYQRAVELSGGQV
jgi:DNA-binding GntR family transcriptional regulator/flavin reductase (DIM6/NTAB) family NADH-FMN oxidoreductase RutF